MLLSAQKRRTMGEKEIRLRKGLEAPNAMEAVRCMAGGVAHDLNNILTAILGFNSLMLREMKEGDQFYPYAKEIEKSANDARVLGEKLIDLSRHEAPVKRPIDLKALVSSAAAEFRDSSAGRIPMIEELTDMPVIEADAEQLSSAIGLVLWWADKHTKGEGLVRMTNSCSRDKARVSIACDGALIDKNRLPYIFEPLYTISKDRMFGYELAIVRGIINEHGGSIEACMTAENVVFNIDLPLRP